MTMLKRLAVICVLALFIISQIGYARGSAQNVGDATPAIEPTQEQTAEAIETPTEEPTLAPTVTETPSNPDSTGTPIAEPTETATATETATPAASPAAFSPAAAISISFSPSNVLEGQQSLMSISGFPESHSVTVYIMRPDGWDDWTSFVIGNSGSTTMYVTIPSVFGHYGPTAVKVTADGNQSLIGQTTLNFLRPGSPAVSLSTQRGSVGARVQYTVRNLYARSKVTITWRRPGGSAPVIQANYFTDDSGTLSQEFIVPGTTAGSGNIITFSTTLHEQKRSVSIGFNIVARILVSPTSTNRNSMVNISLRGYNKGEVVRIRWKINGSWVVVATVSASNTGSANVSVKVPANAPLGSNSVRGDGTTNRQQTNAVYVNS